MSDALSSKDQVSQAPEPTSYVVEGNTYRELIAQRDQMRAEHERLRNHLRQKSEQITRLQDGIEKMQQGSPERSAPEPPAAHDEDEYVFAAGHYSNCAVYEGSQRGPCSCRQIFEQSGAAQPPEAIPNAARSHKPGPRCDGHNCKGHPSNCYGHPYDCGCSTATKGADRV